MTRRTLAFLGGALPVLVCVALAPPVFAQRASNDIVADAGVDDAGVVDGGDVDGGVGDDGGAPVVVADPAPVVAQPAVPAVVAAPKKQTLEPGADTETGVKGHVYDAKTKQPMPMAPVLVKSGGKTRTGLTDEQGGYRLFLPPGTYSVMSYYDMYHGARIKGAKVTRGKLLNLNLMLFPLDEAEEVSIQEFEIAYRADTTSAAAQDQLRLASSSIGEGFGAKQMSQVGASDAGGAAARVVGVQVESNQLVIRGLGGRYTRVLLNGVPVPSTDPDLPGAALDLFPTNVIDSLNISKTFLPSSPADFAGGLMEIKSVNFPRKFLFELQLSTGVRTQTTFRSTPTYKGGKYDYIGFDDGKRSLPNEIPSDEIVTTSREGRYKTFADIDAAARTFPNRWQYSRTSALPKIGVGATLGDSFKFGHNNKLGYLATASYDYEVVRRIGISRPRPSITADGQLITFNNYKLESGTEEVGLTAFATGSLDLGSDHSITALSLFNRFVTDETQIQKGISGELSVDGEIEKWQLQFLARSLLFNQLLGDHRNLLGTRLRFRWTAFQSSGNRSEPDRRTVVYGPQGGTIRWLTRAGSGERFYSDLIQNDIGVTASLRFPLWAEAWGTIGGWAQATSRDFDNRRFRMKQANTGSLDESAYGAPIESLFGPGIGPLTTISEFTREDDSYRAKQTMYAAYALLETPLVGRLSLAGGVRTEIFKQNVESFNAFAKPVQAPVDPSAPPDPNAAKKTDRTDMDYLPGANLKYQLTDTMIFRTAYGITVSRPQTRELAPYQYYDFLRDRNIQGNPDLKRTLIQNADVRWEWFFAEGQVIAFSAFYKNFQDPIELVILNPMSYDSQFRNAKGATNLGVEAEARLNLGRVSKSLRLLNLDGNLALVNSKVQLNKEDAGAVASSRRLFGQAPYVVNFGLRFHNPDTQLTASLIYNVVGPRITDVGTRANDVILPNIEEQPFHSLDFIGSINATAHLKVKLKVRNMLFSKARLKQSNYLTQSIDPGLVGTLSVSYEH